MEILQHQSQNMVHLFREYDHSFDLIELGPGDATKSWHLLKELQKEKVPFTYYPIDISSNVIHWLEDRLPVSLPGIRLHGLNGEYMEKMEQVRHLFVGEEGRALYGRQYRQYDHAAGDVLLPPVA